MSLSYSKAKVAVAFLAAAGSMLGSSYTSAQQMASNSPDFSVCDQLSATAPAKAIKCRVDVLNAHGAAAAARGAVADKRIAAIDDSIACAKFLVAKKAAGVTLDPTRLNRAKGCVYARELGMQ